MKRKKLKTKREKAEEAALRFIKKYYYQYEERESVEIKKLTNLIMKYYRHGITYMERLIKQ